MAQSYGISWEKVLSAGVLDFDPPDKYRQCKLARALGYHFNSSWAATSVFTNVSTGVAVKHRGILKEAIVGGASKTPRALQLTKAVCECRKEWDGGISKTSQGRMSWSHFRRKELRQSPAIRQALERRDFEREMVEDSDSFSSLSIVLLPITLALVPIAMIQEVTALATMLYAVATDVVSVQPIAIKGVELVVYGSQRHYAFNLDLYNMNKGNRSSVVETSAAECGMRPVVRQKGIGLLALACTAMMAGIVLEVLARRCTERRKERRAWENPAVFESEAFLQQLRPYSDGIRKR